MGYHIYTDGVLVVDITWDICLDMFELAASAFEAIGTGTHWLMLTLK